MPGYHPHFLLRTWRQSCCHTRLETKTTGHNDSLLWLSKNMIAAKTFQKLGLIFNSVEIVLNVAKSEQWCGVWYYSGSVVTANVVGPNKRNSDPISRSTSNATKSSARTMQASCCTRCNLDHSEKKSTRENVNIGRSSPDQHGRSTTTLLTPV